MSLLITPSTETRVNTTTASDQFYPSVTALNGGYIVTWMSLSQDGSGYGIYAQRYDASGNTVGSETRVNTTTASDQEFPTVAASFSTAATLRSSQAEKKSMTSAIRSLDLREATLALRPRLSWQLLPRQQVRPLAKF
jgi:hypothetical protein